MKRTKSYSKDYDSIHYIQKQFKEYNDEKLVKVIVSSFEMMCKAREHNGCLSTSVELYIALKYLGYSPKLCYGLVWLPDNHGEKHEFYHAWLELNNKIIDIAIYGNSKFSPLSFFDVNTPICNEEYDKIKEIVDYHPFEFDEDWNLAMISRMQGMKITDYCDGSYKAILWDYICDFLGLSHTNENKSKLRTIVEGEII